MTTRTTVRSNIRVEVIPIAPGNFGIARISGVTRSEDDTIKICEDILRQIRRHVDEFESASVVYEFEHECSACGRSWDDGTSDVNDCCDAGQGIAAPVPA